MVPVRIDALYLSSSEPAAEPTADFRNLPYFDSDEDRDVNSDTPWLGDTVASPPFENSNMTLQAGMHLHWSLPDGLCHGKVVNDENGANGSVEMPTVPNRWLVRRRKSDTLPEERSWVIESDYLWPPQEQAPAINIFHFRENMKGRPYRFLGRKLTLEQWQAEQDSPDDHSREYLTKLTAFGHGEPTFAAYYQNCMTVFGFHDPELVNVGIAEGVHYDLIGWYDSGTHGPVLSWDVDSNRDSSLIEPLRGWRTAAKDGPEQLVCYSSLQVTSGISLSTSSSTTGEYKVAVGNTASEALCALLAKEIADDLKDTTPPLQIKLNELSQQIEEQLEVLNIEGQLASETQDMGLRLRRYRHQKSFAPVTGSVQWTIQADQPDKSNLSDNILDKLRQLNATQARYDRQLQELEHSRRQLYGDWCNYMRCVYRPPDGGRSQYLDIDEIVAFIEERSLVKVQRLLGMVETSRKQLIEDKAVTNALIIHHNQKERSGNTPDAPFVAQSDTPGLPTQFVLRSVPGARHWQPAEPVVLMTGGKIQLGERHGRDSRFSVDDTLFCQIAQLTEDRVEDAMKTLTGPSDLLGWIKEQGELSNEPSIGFQTVDAHRPWNPLFLDWGIDLHSAEARNPDAPGSYDVEVITDNYKLGSKYPDLQPDILRVDDNPDRFSGRCILGSTSSSVMRERIEDTVQRRVLDSKPETWATEAGSVFFKEISAWHKRDEKPHALPTTPAQLQALWAWYEKRPLLQDGNSRYQDPLYCTLCAYRKLFDNADAQDADAAQPLRPRAFLGQALSGFNEELLQWKSGLTLPIDEPIGLKPYRDFSRRIAAAVGRTNEWSPEPTNAFSPLRSGLLKLDSLRLVDSYGQVAKIPVDHEVIIPAPYRVPARPGVAFMPPRLVPPARVTFRWLDARSEIAGEMLEEAALSPICGWLLPERLNGRLLVFSGDGSPLGALAADKNTQTLEWVRAPGLSFLSDEACEAGREWLKEVSAAYYQQAENGFASETQKLRDINSRDLGELGASIDNRRLARVLLYLWATRSSDFLEKFLSTLDNAMANIDPEGTTSMGSMALLMGRPVAVIGAELNLELKDKPAVRQDWTAFMLDQYRHHRDTDAFDRVSFPLRLGQFKSRNDGVLGYWREEFDGFTDNTFVAQAADDNEPGRPLEITETGQPGLTARINAHDANDPVDGLNFTQSVADPPMQTTLLFDPRGRAHLTSGILPVKSIDIPRHLWEPALEAIRVWFPTGPLLSPPNQRRVPTPVLTDRQWSWLERTNNGKSAAWQTVRTLPSLSKDRLQSALNAISDKSFTGSIEELTNKGWLEEQTPVSERLNLGSREAREPLDDSDSEDTLDVLLAQLSLTLVAPDETIEFNPRIDVREGWLMLEPGKGITEQ